MWGATPAIRAQKCRDREEGQLRRLGENGRNVPLVRRVHARYGPRRAYMGVQVSSDSSLAFLRRKIASRGRRAPDNAAARLAPPAQIRGARH